LFAGLFSVPSSCQTPVPITEAEIRAAIGNVDELARNLQKNRETYQAHLKRALKSYGQGFHDPVLGRKLDGFDVDIQTGELDQTEMTKLAIFASLIRTAGIRLDPDLIREWDAVQSLLDTYASGINEASAVLAQTNLYVVGAQSVPDATLRKLKREWRAILEKAERERSRAEAARPEKLAIQQTFSVKAIQGANLHFNFFGIEFGRPLGNAIAYSQLTYLGQVADGEVFLLTTLTAQRSKTRVDTTIQPRAVLVYSKPEDAARYGHIVTSHAYPGRTVLGARVADVADSVEDWVWKTLPPKEEPMTPIAELEAAPGRVQDSRRQLNDSLMVFRRLADEATRDNDSALIAEARLAKKRLRLPEHDLRGSWFQPTRVNLYAGRALAAGDPRFVAALTQVEQAYQSIETRINEEAMRFSALNGKQVETARELPWKRVDALGAELMRAAARAREAAQKSRASLPIALRSDGYSVILPNLSPPQLVVIQTNAGEGASDTNIQVVENILQDVHWAIKGINRRQYTTEFIDTSRDGQHRVERVSEPMFIQGTGGILQVLPQNR